MTVYDMHQQLGRLQAERMYAIEAGLGANAAYMRDLEEDLVATHAAYTGLAVTALASLRSTLFGAQHG